MAKSASRAGRRKDVGRGPEAETASAGGVAVVYRTDGSDVWRLRKSVASLRRVGVRADIFVLTVGRGVDVSDPYLVRECRAFVPVDGILDEVGFSPEGWNRGVGYADLGCLAMPLVEELSGYSRAVSVDSDVLALTPLFAQWLSVDTRGFEVVGVAGCARGARYNDSVEVGRCFTAPGASAQMRERIWRRHPPYVHGHVCGGVSLWDLSLLRSDVGWYRSRLAWFWAAETRGYVADLSVSFVNVFMDSCALLDSVMSETADSPCGPSEEPAARHYGGRADRDVPDCPFNTASADLGIDAYLSRFPSAYATAAQRPAASSVPMDWARAGRVAVVYITDGNKDDARRLTLSARSLARHSSARFDTFVVAPDTTLDLAANVPRLAQHGAVRHITDMPAVLGKLSITDKGWNRAWPFVVLLRLGIPLHPAFAGYDRVLYLDTDTLVMSGDVDRFMLADLSGFEAGGVADTVQEEHGHVRRILSAELRPEHAAKVVARYGSALLERAYINAGVMLWNLAEIRRDIEWYSERLRMFWEAECRGKFGFLDQDFINSMMSVRADFSLVFNWFNGCGRNGKACVVKHYCGHRYSEMNADAAAAGFTNPTPGFRVVPIAW